MDKSEKRFERDIESFLISPAGGYTQFCGQDAEGNWVHNRQHDVPKCIYMDVLCEFIAKTQPKEWTRYTKYYGVQAVDKLYHRLEKAISNQGLLYVLRNGVEDMGCKLKVCFFKPESDLNPVTVEHYEANILGCTRQFRYSTANTNTIDMALSVNGIPVVALELKNQFAGQDYICAINQYQDVELTEDSRMTLSEWLDRWLAEYKDGTIRPGTLESYRNYIENYIKPQLGGKQVSLITTQDVQRMYRRLKSGGRVREDAEGSKRLSDSTVRHIHTMLHGAMKAAVQAHIIPKNPTENATVPKSNYKPMQVLNEQELDTFLQAVQKDSVWRDFFYTELMTGLRRGEICALMWRDFDAKTGTLGISRTLHSKGQGVYALGDTKTSQGNRTIILPESVAALLRVRKKASISQWIFPQPTSPELPMNPGTAYRRLKTLLEEAGLPSIRFHDLRHTFATHALTSGVDAKTLAGILGHTNASFTLDTYTHVTPDMREAAGGIVGGFMEDLFGKELKPWQRSEKQAMD